VKHTLVDISPTVKALCRDGEELKCPYTGSVKVGQYTFGLGSCGTWCPLFEIVSRPVPAFAYYRADQLDYVRLHCGTARIYIDK